MPIGNIRFTRGMLRAALHFGMAGPGPGLAGWVQPVMDTQWLSGLEENDNASVSVGANGTYPMATVPEGELWIIKWLTYKRLSGDFTITSLNIEHTIAANGNIEIEGTDVTSEKTTPTAFLAGGPHLMYPGQAISITAGSFVGTGNVNMRLRKFVFAYGV